MAAYYRKPGRPVPRGRRVINKADEDEDDGTRRPLLLDETGLRAEWPTIVTILRTSCRPGHYAKRTIDQLKETIVETLNEHPHLEHVRDPIPPQWRRIKDAVTGRARADKVLALRDFERLCESTEEIDDPHEQRALLRLLHDLGVVVAHGLEKWATAIVREVTLLDPNWLTGAIYTVLNHRRVAERAGEFSKNDLHELLDPDQYPASWHPFVLEMMQHPDVGLCFPMSNTNGERFLIPEALPKDSPSYGQWPADTLRFRYKYELDPARLMPRFIVAAHQQLAKGATRWRTGAVFDAADCAVLVTADRVRKRIDLRVRGPAGRRRSALNVIVTYLENVHRLNPEAKPRAVVPLPDTPEVSVSYTHLLRLEGEEGPDHRFLPEDAKRRYTVRELLEGVRQAPEFGSPTTEASVTINVTNNFHSDMTYGDRLEGDKIVGDSIQRKTSTKLHNTGQIQSLAVGESTANTTQSNQSVNNALAPPKERDLDRDEFERDLGEILTLLVDAKEELEADYQTVRTALRKLNLIDLEQMGALSSLHAKLDEHLNEQDKSILKKIADAKGAVAANLVSSAIWQYALLPVIHGVT